MFINKLLKLPLLLLLVSLVISLLIWQMSAQSQTSASSFYLFQDVCASEILKTNANAMITKSVFPVSALDITGP